MSWETLNINEIPVEDSKPLLREPIPNGTYTLQLMGAAESQFRQGALNITTSVADEGTFAGRRVFIDLPNPDEQPWSAQVLARMVTAMGANVAPYSNVVEELNRIAQNGHSRFTADIYTEKFTRNDGTEGTKNKVSYRSIRAAA